jgi:hypothetical protein
MIGMDLAKANDFSHKTSGVKIAGKACSVRGQS